MRLKALAFGLAMLATTGCLDDTEGPVEALEQEQDEAIPLNASEVARDAYTPRPREVRRLYRTARRTDLGGGLAHYQFEVRVGLGTFDVVRLHRVVRERTPNRPARTQGAVFLTHGASLDFDAIFLTAGNVTPGRNTSFAMYLASEGVDVWGMDFAWTRVPDGTKDFSFMKEWGLERDADHTRRAMAVARIARGLTGQGFGKMHLLGYSYGVGVAYAAAVTETREPRWKRDIRGLIPVDQAVKFADDNAQQWACSATEVRRADLANGTYEDSGGVRSAGLGQLAVSDPSGPSPAVPGLTNMQAAMFIGAQTFVVQALPTPVWHFVAGDSPARTPPGALLYTDADRWARMLAGLPPYMPLRARTEVSAIQCEEHEAVDDLARIKLPILYVGAAGAVGTLGVHTGELTASRDNTVHIVGTPGAQALGEYGHADLFLGRNASSESWIAVAEWLLDRGRRARREVPGA